MNKMAVYLNQHIDGVVYSSPDILENYSTDRSILKYMPKFVAIPADVMDVRRLVKFSSQLASKGLQMPITVRGAGYSKTGACLGNGLIISTEKLNKIQEVDVRQRLIRVQAGVKLGELQKALALHALELPIVGAPEETIGGLISRGAQASNNTTPSTIADFVERAEVVLADGSLVEIGKMSSSRSQKKAKQDDFEGRIYAKMNEILVKNSALIAKQNEKILDHSFFAHVAKLKEKRCTNLIPLFCGAEGTLGVITEVILKCEPIFENPNWIAVACNNAATYQKAAGVLKKIGFTDLYVYDTEIFADSESTGKTSKFFRKPGRDGYLIIANAKDDSRMKRKMKLSKLKSNLPQVARLIEITDENRHDFEVLDETLLAYLNSPLRGFRVPVVEDVYIPEEKQAEFMTVVDSLGDELKMRLAVFGRPEYNTFNVRPTYIPTSADGLKRMVTFIQKYLQIVKDFGGYCCGGSSEGRMMGAFVRATADKSVVELAKVIKDAFDPEGILNPGTKHEASPSTVFKHLRKEYSNTVQSIY